MQLIAVGKLKPGAERELFERYQRRLRPALAVREIPEGAGAPHEAKRRENEALLAAVPATAFAVALDLGGATTDSAGFAALLARWAGQGRTLAFLIGGAEGLNEAVLARADAVISLGAMTWPHGLVRVMLAEQLYRAQSIAAGHPYHRSARP